MGSEMCIRDRLATFGAFISLLPGKDGLLHISEVRKLVGGKRIDAVEDVLGVGQKVQVELKEIDPRGKLSLAAVLPEGEGEGGEQAEAGDGESGDRESSDRESGDRESSDREERGSREERGERREGGRGRGRNRRRGDRGDRAEQGTATPEADQLVEAHDSGAAASSEDAAN